MGEMVLAGGKGCLYRKHLIALNIIREPCLVVLIFLDNFEYNST